MSVTESARVSMSALDCELEASATAAIPETARLRRTATREAPPTRMGRPRTSVSLLRTQLSTHSCRGRSAPLTQHACLSTVEGDCGGENAPKGRRRPPLRG